LQIYPAVHLVFQEQPMNDRRRVLFLCTHNSARSQMAEGLLRTHGGDDYEVFSAGTVATQVRPEAITVMAEIGIDISGQHSKELGEYLGQLFDEVITVCDEANDACPVFPGACNRRHWSVKDPSGAQGTLDERLAAFRAARNELESRIQATFA
jgi:arsenate reductase